MAAVIAQFFGIMGLSPIPPDNLAELIPYLFTVLVGVALASGVFQAIGSLAEVFLASWRWR